MIHDNDGLPIDAEASSGDEANRVDPHRRGPADDVFRREEGTRYHSRLRTWGVKRAPTYGAIFVGGLVGGGARYLLDRAFPTPVGGFPWTIFLVNVSGAFVLAVLLVLIIELWQPGPLMRPLLATGLLGSFTTFSTYVLAADRLWAGGADSTAVTYTIGSLVAGLAGVSFGLVFARAVVTFNRISEAE